MLSGVNVALGVTGSIAAVRVVELVHELRRLGAAVRGVTTDSSAGILHPWAVEFATGRDVVTEITGGIEHVELCGEDGWADVLLIAPATANTVGKVAAAIDDTPVTTCATTALGSDLPVVVAPAMHEPMYDHPGVLEAIERLESWGVSFVDPRIEEGKAKIAESEAIALAVRRSVGPTPLSSTRVVVTAGATAEPIDPVRVLTSRASGRTGRAVARGCYALGADVTLVQAGGSDRSVPYASVEPVTTANDMLEAVSEAVADADALVSAAAIGDYTIESAAEKIESGQSGLTLELEPTPKVLDAVRDAEPELPIVGFKVESATEESAIVDAARTLQERVGLSFVVANHASVMGEAETSVQIVDGGTVDRFDGTKEELGLCVARELGDRL